MAHQLVRTVSSLGSAGTGAFVPAAEAAVGAVTGVSSRNITSSSGSLPSSSGSQLSSSRSQPTSRTGYTASADILARQAALNAGNAAEKAAVNFESFSGAEVLPEAVFNEGDIEDKVVRDLLSNPNDIPELKRGSTITVIRGQRTFVTATYAIQIEKMKRELQPLFKDMCSKHFGSQTVVYSLGKSTTIVRSFENQLELVKNESIKMLKGEANTYAAEVNKLKNFVNDIRKAKNATSNKTILYHTSITCDQMVTSALHLVAWGTNLIKEAGNNQVEIDRALELYENTRPTDLEKACKTAEIRLQDIFAFAPPTNAHTMSQVRSIHEIAEEQAEAALNNPKQAIKFSTEKMRSPLYKPTSRFLHGRGARLISGESSYEVEHIIEVQEVKQAWINCMNKNIADFHKMKNQTQDNKNKKEAERKKLDSIFKDVNITAAITYATNCPISNGFLLERARNQNLKNELLKEWGKAVKEYMQKNPGQPFPPTTHKQIWIDVLTGKNSPQKTTNPEKYFTTEQAEDYYANRKFKSQNFKNILEYAYKEYTGSKTIPTYVSNYFECIQNELVGIIDGVASMSGGVLPFILFSGAMIALFRKRSFAKQKWPFEILEKSIDQILEDTLSIPLESQLDQRDDEIPESVKIDIPEPLPPVLFFDTTKINIEDIPIPPLTDKDKLRHTSMISLFEFGQSVEEILGKIQGGSKRIQTHIRKHRVTRKYKHRKGKKRSTKRR